MSSKNAKAPWVNPDLSKKECILELYQMAYYPIATIFMEEGRKEVEVKGYFKKALAYFMHQLQSKQFDEGLDIVQYLLTVMRLMMRNTKENAAYVDTVPRRKAKWGKTR